ncbi:MAG: DUF2283 domain-containing protein, partial [Armatimonadetes bacterium]|nr:DUF2283 domain-containing protein [Armatimonadota bacterium]
MNPRIEYVDKHNILYIEFSDVPVARTVERHSWAILDLDAENKPVSVEILGASKIQPHQVVELLRELADFTPRSMPVLLAGRLRSP